MYSDCIPDNYDLWKSRDREQEEWLQHRPKCICCGISRMIQQYSLMVIITVTDVWMICGSIWKIERC